MSGFFIAACSIYNATVHKVLSVFSVAHNKTRSLPDWSTVLRNGVFNGFGDEGPTAVDVQGLRDLQVMMRHLDRVIEDAIGIIEDWHKTQIEDALEKT